MKKIVLSFTIYCASISLIAQSISDSILLGASYSNQSYYSLEDGEIKNIDNTDWDIAFDVSGFGSTIRINDAQNSMLYMYPASDTSGWLGLDTIGSSNWDVLYNSDKSWGLGAFSATSNGNFDVGWGNYNPTTHHIIGDSLYVIKLSNNSWKKIWIQKLVAGIFTFKYADIDGSNEFSTTITKGDYSNKNFVYYSLQNGSVIDREPINTEWDLLFTKYVTEFYAGIYYGVTGVLSNKNIGIAKKYPVADPLTITDYKSLKLDSSMNVIGYDWKSFNMSTFQYDLADSTAYFVNDIEGNIWRIVFTKFVGSSTGEIAFNKELVEEASFIEDNDEILSFTIYPNPASQIVNVIHNTTYKLVKISIIDITGKVVMSEEVGGNGFNQHSIVLDDLDRGIYFIRLSTQNSFKLKKLIIK